MPDLSQYTPAEQTRRGTVVLLVISFLAVVALIVYVDRTYLDPGGCGMACEANNACRSHEGVRYMNAHQGTIICRDGWVGE